MNGEDKRKVIIVGNGFKNSISDNLFKDVIENTCKNAEYYFLWEIKNPLISFIQKRYYARKWNLYKKMPAFNKFFLRYNAFEKIKKKEKDAIIIVNLASQYANMTTKDEIISLRSAGFTVVLFCVDAVDSPQMNNGEVISWFPLFDLVVSDSIEDSKKYNLYYHMDPYPWKDDAIQNDKCENDLFFCGRGKDRVAFCKKIFSYLSKRNVKCDFTVVELGGKKCEKESFNINSDTQQIKYRNTKVPYESIIKGVAKSNCILEILAYSNDASIRYFEAIVFNKKLLTNNKNAYLLPFYNPNYMKIIDSPEEINIKWLKDRTNIDYGYNGEFSPALFIDDIRNEIERRGI